MNLPLFHDPLKGRVTVDAPVRDPRIGRDTLTRTAPRVTRASSYAATSTRSARQREVARVAEDLQALMDRTTLRT